MPEHLHMFGSSDHADSAGRPWKGRSFDDNAFAQDDGSAPPELLEALQHFRAQEHSSHVAVAHQRVVDVLRTSRLLIPLIAQAGEVGVTPEGLTVDKTQELSIVTVEGPRGQKVLPVFSSVDTMQRWNTQSRPVPVDARRAALAAAADGAQWIVLDPTSETEMVFTRPQIEAIAQDTPWIPAYADPALAEVFMQSCLTEDSVVSIQLTAGDPHARGQREDLVIELALTPGLDSAQVDTLLERLSRIWSTEQLISQRVDSMKVQLRAAT